ncbi:MAG: carbamate kinase [Spirochaetaceae bacterium]
MSGELVVIALGGNAIKQGDQEGTTEEQFLNVDKTAKQLAHIVKAGYRPVITHGNGPQAGSLLIQQEEARDLVPAQSLAVCGAMTQGQIGWMMQNRIDFRLKEMEIKKAVCSVITQVEVSEDDPDFQNPSKPVGPFYTEEEAKKLKDEKGYVVKEAKPGTEKAWRRVVPSPEPIGIVEEEALQDLVKHGVLIIASGGGGIPVKKEDNGEYSGIDAVIDKDRAGFKLAQAVNADKFVILTDVEKVYINFNKPDQKGLDKLTVAEAEAYMNEGHFLAGSMGPKVQAAVRFAKWSKKEAIITSLDKAVDALAGKTGTHIVA